MVRKATTKAATKATSATKVKPRRTASVKVKPTVVESAPAPVARKKKASFRAGTLIAVLLLIGLLELAFYLKDKKEKDTTAEATPVSETAALFNVEDGMVSSIEIKPADGGETVKVARNAENAWAIVLPFEAEADQGLVEAAATQVSALRVLSPISGAPEIFGLKNPAFTITVEFKDGNKHTLEVGDATPTNSGYYVRLDKDKMMITDLSGIGSLLELAKYPPYLNTPTPTALPATPTPVPATEAVSTPTP
jgi:Domain of unknown function (DUF4340)